jgi:hypothetical protein
VESLPALPAFKARRLRVADVMSRFPTQASGGSESMREPAGEAQAA